MTLNWQSSLWKLCIAVPIFTGWLVASIGTSAVAQITPDGTLGNEASQVKPINNNVDRIDGGAVRGGNLFHSFQDFNVGEGRGAYFANPVGVENILSRVTGSNPSNIFGTLGVLGNANLFLLNPNGIIFGSNARLDIRGSFVGSAAGGVNFSDRTFFGGKSQTAPLLTMAVPIGLQYGMQQAGNISNSGNLAVGQGQKLALVGGTVTSNGQLTAPGGTIHVLGNRVGLLDNARVDVSSETGGGTVLIGGDFQGKGEVPNALRTFVSPNATINADALVSGDGGRVIVWADEVTGFYGNISARGGGNSGNGGFVEVSGKEALQFAGFVDTNAPFGLVGTLLLDPKDILVQEGGSNPATSQVFELNSTAKSTISGANLSAALNTTGVTLQANNDIIIDDNVTGTTFGNGLTLQAGRSIILNPNRTVNINNANFSVKINDERAETANRDLGTAQFLMNNGSQILTNNGNVRIEHGAFGGSAVGQVLLDRATINSGTGNISMIGTGKNGGNANYGIWLNNSSVVSSIGNGTITLNGTSGSGDSENTGVYLSSGAKVRSTDGVIQLTGISNGSVQENHGINISDNVLVESTGNGNIILRGNNNSTGTLNNDGIAIRSSSTVETKGDGTISMTGISGSGKISDGIFMDNSKVISSNGIINLTGTSNGFGNTEFNVGNYGIGIGENGLVQSLGLGNIILTGTNNAISADNYGVAVLGNGIIKSTKSGAITLKSTVVNVSQGILLDKSVIESSGLFGSNINLSSNGNIKINQSDIVGISTGLNQGSIEINAPVISLSDARIANIKSGEGQSGNISINASDSLTIINTDNLNNFTEKGSLLLQELQSRFIGSGISNYAVGRATSGDITIDTKKLIISNESKSDNERVGITTSTRGSRNSRGGALTIKASESVEVTGNQPGQFKPEGTQETAMFVNDLSTGLTTASLGEGDAGNLSINTGKLIVRDGAGIGSGNNLRNERGSGDGGNLIIDAREVDLIGKAALATSTTASSKPGTLKVNAGEVNLKDGALFAADTLGNNPGGNIEIVTNRLRLQSGSRIGAATRGSGIGGKIIINTPDKKAELVEIEGTSADGNLRSGIFTNSEKDARAGDILIYTENLNLLNRGEISVSGSSSGSSGNLNITAGNIFMNQQARIRATTNSGEGNINLTVTDSIKMENDGNQDFATEITAQAFGAANGGNITLRVGKWIFANIQENSDIVAEAFGGNGGKIDATVAGSFGFIQHEKGRRLPESEFIASSTLGQNGIVDVNTQDFQPIPIPDVPVVREVPQVCPTAPGVNSRAAGRSAFSNAGRGGLPPNPGDVLESNITQVPWVTLDSQNTSSRTTNSSTPATAKKPVVISEAQGWQKRPNGRVKFTTQTSSFSFSSCIVGDK